MMMTHNQLLDKPLEYYAAIYRGLDAQDVSQRCGLDFDGEAFSLRLMGSELRLGHPEFSVLADSNGTGDCVTGYEKILLIRYLCEGRAMQYRGKQLSYLEIPWGEVYYRNFEGRCLFRAARVFGGNLDGFRRVMESLPRSERVSHGDAGYRFEFINDFYMTIIIWAGDDEFPAHAQILFDDNVVFAFSAEDAVAAADTAIGRISALL
jgi:hypothetical protein